MRWIFIFVSFSQAKVFVSVARQPEVKPWDCQICLAKFLYSYRDNLPVISGQNHSPKNAKRPLPVEPLPVGVRCSKTSYYLVQTPVCCSISGYPQKPHRLRAVCYCGLCLAGIYPVTLSALQYNCKYDNIFCFWVRLHEISLFEEHSVFFSSY